MAASMSGVGPSLTASGISSWGDWHDLFAAAAGGAHPWEGHWSGSESLLGEGPVLKAGGPLLEFETWVKPPFVVRLSCFYKACVRGSVCESLPRRCLVRWGASLRFLLVPLSHAVPPLDDCLAASLFAVNLVGQGIYPCPKEWLWLTST